MREKIVKPGGERGRSELWPLVYGARHAGGVTFLHARHAPVIAAVGERHRRGECKSREKLLSGKRERGKEGKVAPGGHEERARFPRVAHVSTQCEGRSDASDKYASRERGLNTVRCRRATGRDGTSLSPNFTT